MAGRGRGRGRGLLATVPAPGAPGSRENEEEKGQGDSAGERPASPDPPSPQPPQPAPEAAKPKEAPVKKQIDPRGEPTLDEVESLLGDLCPDLEDRDLENVNNLAEEAVRTAGDMETLARLLYNKTLGDHTFAKNAALITNRLSNMERDGRKFRNCVLSLVQTDFKGKDRLQKEESSRFVGFVTILCSLFQHLRMTNGEPLDPLIPPIFELLTAIVQNESPASADQCECLAMQLFQIGRTLERTRPEDMETLMELIRRRIIQNDTSPAVRCQLLEVVESYGRGWTEASQDVQRFYLDLMADVLTEIM